MLGDILVERGVITADQLAAALARQKSSGELLGTVLREMGVVSEEDIARALAYEAGLAFVRLSAQTPDSAAVSLVPEAFARRAALAPVSVEMGTLRVAQANPFDVLALDELHRVCGCTIEPVGATPGEVAAFVDRCYGPLASRRPRTPPPAPPPGRGAGTSLEDLFERVRRAGARVVHIDRGPEGARVRLRAGDTLVIDESLAARITDRLIHDLETRAGLHAADAMAGGAFDLTVAGAQLRLVVSRTAAASRDGFAIRLDPLPPSPLSLEALGFSRRNLSRLEEELQRRGTLTIVAAPMGGGKTTTLQAIGRAAAAARVVAACADWPAEAEGIHLVPRRGDTADRVRVLLRQDLDMLIVDPIDDGPTAMLALDAACAGVSVVASVHATGAHRAIALLAGFGVPHSSYTTVAGAVVTQRLVRRICRSCRKPATYSADTLARVGLDAGADVSLWRGEGCDVCQSSGFNGWTGVFEALPHEVVSGAVRDGRPIADAARTANVHSLGQEALVRVFFGDLALEDLLSEADFVSGITRVNSR